MEKCCFKNCLLCLFYCYIDKYEKIPSVLIVNIFSIYRGIYW